jgi:hypothetical protein
MMGPRARVPTAVFALVIAGMGIVGCAPVRSNVVSVGAWELTVRRDVVTELDASLAIAWARVHPLGATASGLAILCDASYRYGIAIFLAADRGLGADDRYDVELRFGRAEPVTSRWDAASSARAVSLPATDQPAFLGSLRANPRLAVRIMASPEAYSYVIDTSGLDVLLAQMPC